MRKIIKKLVHILPFKKTLFSCLKVLPIPEKIYRHLYFKGVIKLRVENSIFKMYHYGFQLENELFWKGLNNGWEKESIKLWSKLSKSSAVILDIGANTGVFGLISKSLNPNATIISFEPVKRVYDKLQLNVELNQFDISCRETALSNFDGKATIYDLPEEHIYSVTVNKDFHASESNSFPVEIIAERLDSFIKATELGAIDLMKIDVETHEAEVLEGMGDYLKLFQPTILIELLNDDVAQKVEQIIKDIPYLYFNIDENNGVSRSQNLKKSTGYNYLICNERIAKELKLL